MFLDPPATEPLFQNLRSLSCECTEKAMPLLRLPLPSLVHIHLWLKHPRGPPNPLESFSSFSPDIRTIFVGRHGPDSFTEIEPNALSRWQNLSCVAYYSVALNMVDLAHLSRIPTLTRLECALRVTWPASDSPLDFTKLQILGLHSHSLETISQLLSQIRLPVITSLQARIEDRPSSQVLASFLAGVSTSNSGDTVEILRLDQWHRFNGDALREAASPDFEGLQPYMKFRNLRKMKLNVTCDVALADSGLLALASAWPMLECFDVNAEWGWNTTGGITPGGLTQLLQTCPSLTEITVCLDTRGYTEVPPSHVLKNLGLTLSPELWINVVNSAIEVECLPAVAAFFCALATCFNTRFCFLAWSCYPFLDPPDVYEKRWLWVERQIHDALCRHGKSGDGDGESVNEYSDQDGEDEESED